MPFNYNLKKDIAITPLLNTYRRKLLPGTSYRRTGVQLNYYRNVREKIHRTFPNWVSFLLEHSVGR